MSISDEWEKYKDKQNAKYEEFEKNPDRDKEKGTKVLLYVLFSLLIVIALAGYIVVRMGGTIEWTSDHNKKL